MIRLHKSEDPNDSLSFVGQEMIIPTYTEVTKRDSIVNYNGSRYRAYVYINPSKMRVIKTIYTEDGISMDNVYYDNVMHICEMCIRDRSGRNTDATAFGRIYELYHRRV